MEAENNHWERKEGISVWKRTHLRRKAFHSGISPCDLAYSSPSSSALSLYKVSVICGQLQSKNIKWKIPETNDSELLNCMAVLSSVTKSRVVWNVNHPWSCISVLYTLPALESRGRHLGYQMDCHLCLCSSHPVSLNSD